MKQFVPVWIKDLLKKYCWRLVFSRKMYRSGKLKNLAILQDLQKQPDVIPVLNVFTSHNEDGIIQFLIAKLPALQNPVFIDIGSNDCINSNCANLAFHHQWKGVFIDGNLKLIKRGKHIYNAALPERKGEFDFLNIIVTPENIDLLLKENPKSKNADLLSIDLDGNDYHIWNAIKSISPKIVITEVQIEKGLTKFIPAYEKTFEKYESNTPKGASPLSMIELAKSKGYELAAFNTKGFNLFFVAKKYSGNFKIISSGDFKKHFHL
ncbi:MAG: hypothetical protein K2X48_19605 [Chitinophagaceae bacterium]|nr:hypothetical protein [Chitinophagaceae bacterium]